MHGMTELQAISKLSSILEEAKTAGWSQNELKNTLESELASSKNNPSQKSKKSCVSFHYLIFRLLPLLFAITVLYFPASKLLTDSPCIVLQLTPLGDAIHPLIDCEICQGVTEAPHLVNLSQDDFIHYYAYESKPILVVGAAAKWPALELFSYDYFKNLYLQTPDALNEKVIEDTQFFSYSSDIANLKELFELPSEVATMTREKWYIGWSTTDPNVGKELRKHFSSPYFIPPGLSDLTMAWIFMGAPGPGASIHIDMVDLPSWQAQLSGTKTWTLTPPPECEHVCQEFNVTVHKGDIIVVDTNNWYHQTYIHPGNISITIGSEYN